ncbi:MAG: glycoside hydrolase family 3 N-terminal domain-containing protein [Spirochaetota bacterium]
MVGYPGTSPGAELGRWIEARGIGGVKIFGWNAQDTQILASTIKTLQEASLGRKGAIPLLVATDQEGGWIRHVKGRSSESPGNMALGATGSASDSYRAGYFIGKELAVLGIRMNFAPVVDLATDPSSDIIGPRAFSQDPGEAARLGLAFARGSLAAGVIPTAKHYPGHGATPFDSHGVLPEIEVDQETFRARELAPFAFLAERKVPAMMSGHLAFPLIDPSRQPASLSRRLIQEELRDRLGYGGLLVTDDLHMAGATGDSSLAQAFEDAVRAGNDMILLSVTPDLEGGLWRRLLSLYREDEGFARRVREAALRVLETKIAYLKPLGRQALLPSPQDAKVRLPDPEAQTFFLDLARRSATLIQGKENLPFAPKGSILVAGPYDSFLRLGAKAYPGARTFKLRSGDQMEEFRRQLAGADGVLLCIAGESQRKYAAAALDKGIPTAIVSVLSPYRVRDLGRAEAIVAVYHYAEICLQAGLEVLKGTLRPRGELPLELKGKGK